MGKATTVSKDGSILLMWKAIHISGKEVYQFEPGTGKENLSKIFFDWDKKGELNELILVDMKTREEVVAINLMDGSIVIEGRVIPFKNDGAPYRAIYYGVTKRKTFGSDEFAKLLNLQKGIPVYDGDIIKYCLGWQYCSQKGINKRAILELDAKTAKWKIII